MSPEKSATVKRKAADAAGGKATKRRSSSGPGGAGESDARAPASAPDVSARVSAELGIEMWRVQGAMKLFADGATLPFVARYRKEQTGSMDETQLRALQNAMERAEALEVRRGAIVKALTAAGTLTAALSAAIRDAPTLQALEDVYLPHRPKRKTRASDARELGLQPLADLMRSQPSAALPFPEALLLEPWPAAKTLLKAIGGGCPPADALQGARDILAEELMEDPQTRALARRVLSADAQLVAKLRSKNGSKAADPQGAFKAYHAFQMPLARLRPYQTLAVARGEREKALSVKVQAGYGDKEACAGRVWARVGAVLEKRLADGSKHPPQTRALWAKQRKEAIDDGLTRLLLPALEREWWKEALERAEVGSLEAFASNLRSKLLQPPVKGAPVLAIDPGFKAGCKVAVVSATGDVLGTATVFPQRAAADASAALARLLAESGCKAVALGNGHGSREAEAFLAAEVRAGRLPEDLQLTVVDEAGASVYSASELAAKELAGMDVTERGAVSLARRVQDPLAELVKVEPKSLGVGLYQHDMAAVRLARELRGVVEDAVNTVGVDLNTASPALLQYVAGLHAGTAAKVVAHREAHGPFRSRAALAKVAGIGPKAFQQAAGFCRVFGSSEPLDATAVHPESYAAARALIAKLGGAGGGAALISAAAPADAAAEAAAVGVGEATLADMLEALRHPGRDPRETLLGVAAPAFRSGKALARAAGGGAGAGGNGGKGAAAQAGQQVRGVVRNVVEFGAFVDIGGDDDGLLHRSRIPPGMALQNGQVLRVVVDKVTEVEGADGKDAKRAGKAAGKRRISLALDTSGVVELD